MSDETTTNKYSAFSGTDIKAFCPLYDSNGNMINIPFLELQTITVSTHRQTHPVVGAGTFNTLGFTRGHRLIAGSLIIYNLITGGIEQVKKYHPRLNNVAGRKNILVDQIPPFDIMISYVNEAGLSKFEAIFGITLISHGKIISINDLATETTMQYVALDYQPLEDGKPLSEQSHDGKTIAYMLNENIKKSNIRNNPFLIKSS